MRFQIDTCSQAESIAHIYVSIKPHINVDIMTQDFIAERASEHETSEVEAAFESLCDVKTGRLKHRVCSKSCVEAIKALNRATAKSVLLLTSINRYAIGCTLCQGVCLIAAVFWHLGLMVPAWTGPTAKLSDSSVHILATFTRTGTRKVRLPVRWAITVSY